MDPGNNQNNAPDSWDADMNNESVDSSLNKPLTALNINAPEFVPGQNPYAASFVPSGFSSSIGRMTKVQRYNNFTLHITSFCVN